MKIKVLVADDHPTFRDGLCRFLEDEEDIEIVAKPQNGKQAVILAKELQPDVAIIDVSMPELNGIEATKQIKSACPDIAILMVSAFDYESYIRASLQAGAAGYMLKTAPTSELVSAIRLVSIGEAVFDMKTAGRIMHNLFVNGDEEGGAFARLYPREIEILKQAAKGKSNKAIGEELVISERTVQTHMVHIFKKLEVGSRTEAVLRALKDGCITIDDLS